MRLSVYRAALLPGALAFGILTACGPASTGTRSRPETPARAVQVTPATPRRMERTVGATGTLAAQESSVLSTKVGGRILRLAVDLGSVVRAGDLIAQIEPRDFELRVQEAVAALAQARAELGLPVVGDDDQVTLDTVSSVKQAWAVRDEAAKNRERIANLSKTGIASPSELDTAEAASTVAQTRYDAALEAARARIATLAQRRAAYQIAQKQLADTTVTAPYDGVIQNRASSVGEYVATGTPLVTLVKTDPLRLRLDVPERESALVAHGQPVRLVAEGLTNVFTGRIARLSPALNPLSRMLRVEADVPNPGALRAGLFARAQIVINAGEDALSIPAEALITFAGIEKVITVEGGKAREIPVTTGRRGPGWIEVLSGIAAGTPVVLRPEGLRSGQPVALAPALADTGTPPAAGLGAQSRP